MIELEATHNANSPKIKPEDTEHYKIYQTIFNFYSFLGKSLGYETSYDWQPARHIMFWISNFYLVFSWTCFLKTQTMHLINGAHMKNLEVFAVYGIALSTVLKTVGYLSYWKEILTLFKSMRKLCRENLVGRRAQILKAHLAKSFLILKLFAVGASSTVGLFCACPILTYVKNNWLPGYAIALALFMEMAFYCFMGTQIMTSNERLCSIIEACNWYAYDRRSQKMILELIHSCQHADELWIGFLAPLSILTGIEIVKSIYSYYTILTELL